ncbi:MAG: hypothetical protein ABI847_20885, partial [Anaerolineales bacterium]
GPANGMLALRLLTKGLGAITSALLYLAAARLTRSVQAGLLAAGAYAVYPQAVLYSRFGFSYNLLAPLMLLALWGSGEYLARAARPKPRGATTRGLSTAEGGAEARRGGGWLALAAVAIGLGVLGDLWMGAMLLPFMVVVALGRPRDGLWAVPLLALPFALYTGGSLLTAPSAFVFDAAFAAGRLGGAGLGLGRQAGLLVENLFTLISQDGWLALGLAGVFALRPARTRNLALLWVWAPFVLIGRTVPMFSLSYYYMIPLLPLAALGLGAGVERLFSAMQGIQRRHRLARLAVSAGVMGLALLAGAQAVSRDWGQAMGQIPTDIDPFLVAPAEARAAAEFVNARAAPEDVVIASPAVAWLVRGRVADFQMALAYSGAATPHLPANLPRERFAFDPRFERARFVVVDDLWRNWGAADVAGLAAELEGVRAGWRLVFQAGAVDVYERTRAAGGGFKS